MVLPVILQAVTIFRVEKPLTTGLLEVYFGLHGPTLVTRHTVGVWVLLACDGPLFWSFTAEDQTLSLKAWSYNVVIHITITDILLTVSIVSNSLA